MKIAAFESLEYPGDLAGEVTLDNRRTLRVRPLRRNEEEPVRELFAALSPRTRYRRFLSPMPTLPDAITRLLTRVDYRRRLALIAEHDGTAGREVVAMASFGAVDEGTAEVSLVVRDDWQHQGVGIALGTRVLQAAEARGYHRFIVHFLSDNVAVRRFLRHVGEVVMVRVTGGFSEVVFVRQPPPTTTAA
ncbi:MAG TPA: GNAT family N-acetyltransferase [Vicinamibacterales bacterium]|jgi:GNAT superfamily N-acetyltransferase